jgi:1-acyl-sn-glycerol-3-phosphate acyltransferase
LLQRLSLYCFHVFFVRPVLRWIAGIRFRRRNVPEGPCLVVSNHNSHLDAAVLMTIFPLRRLAQVHPVAAADYFGTSLFMRVMAMSCMNGIPIDRRPSRGEDPLAPLADRLKSGQTLIFFPEGSRGEAGVVARFRSGIGKLVQSVPGLLVVPVFIAGPERIWPRGELVPVPLSVDVNIGKPRTYPALEDPREIADQVRKDVLALAPPPPPVPGERAAAPLRIAVCGVDDACVSEVFRQVALRLGRLGPTLGVADQVLEADPAGVRETTGPVPVSRERAWLGLLSAVFRTGPRFKGGRFVRLIERAQLNEALSQGYDTRFVVEDGSVLADLLATALADLGPEGQERRTRDLLHYLTGERKVPLGRKWRTIRETPEIWLINGFNLTRATVPEILVHVTLPVSEVMQKLRSRGVPLLAYQSESGLEQLQQAYREAAQTLRRRRRVELLELDLSTLDAEQAAERVAAACDELAGAATNVSPGS